jgi:hypothetical protein
LFHLRIICLSLSHSLWPPSLPAVFYQFAISCHPTMRRYTTSSNKPKVSIKLVTTDVCNFCLKYLLMRFSLPKQGYGSPKITKQTICFLFPLLPFLSSCPSFPLVSSLPFCLCSHRHITAASCTIDTQMGLECHGPYTLATVVARDTYLHVDRASRVPNLLHENGN